MNTIRSTRMLGVAAATALVLSLAACGGDDDVADEPVVSTADTASEITPAPTDPPGSSPASVDATAIPETSASGPATTTSAEGGLDPDDPVHVAIAINSDEPTLANIYVGMDAGVFQRHGLEVELVALGVGAIPVLQSGDVQFIDGSLGVLGGQLEGAEIIAVGRSAVTSHFVIAGPDSGVTTPADLDGKSIGIGGVGGLSDFQTRRMLQLAGVPEENVDIVSLGGQGVIIEAVRSGEVAAGYVTYVAAAEAEAFGAQVIASRQSGLDPDVLSYSIGVGRDYAAEHPEVVRAYLAALSEATELMLADRTLADQALAEHLGLSLEDAATQYDVYADGFSPDLSLPIEFVESFLVFSNAPDTDPTSLFTDEYLP